MSGLAIASAALLAAAGTGGAYYYFEVYKKATTVDASGANTAVLAAAAPAAAATTTTPTGTSGETGTSATAVSYAVIAGLDNNGSDVSSSTGTSLDACTAACTANPACVASESKTTGECWLKSAIVPSQLYNPAANLGASLSLKNAVAVKGTNAVGTDYPNSDLSSFQVAGESDCQQLGMMAPGAVASVFAPNEKTCWLKSGLGGATSNGDRNTFTFAK